MKNIEAVFTGKVQSVRIKKGVKYLIEVESDNHGNIHVRAGKVGDKTSFLYLSITDFLNSWSLITNCIEDKKPKNKFKYKDIIYLNPKLSNSIYNYLLRNGLKESVPYTVLVNHPVLDDTFVLGEFITHENALNYFNSSCFISESEYKEYIEEKIELETKELKMREINYHSKLLEEKINDVIFSFNQKSVHKFTVEMNFSKI